MNIEDLRNRKNAKIRKSIRYIYIFVSYLFYYIEKLDKRIIYRMLSQIFTINLEYTI